MHIEFNFLVSSMHIDNVIKSYKTKNKFLKQILKFSIESLGMEAVTV